MKKVNLLVMLVALGVIAWAVPATSALAVTHNAMLTAQQKGEPAHATTQPAQEESQTQTFSGQITLHNGKYMLHGDDNKAYNLDDQEKAKSFDGKRVHVTGVLDQQSMTIQVTDIQEAQQQ